MYKLKVWLSAARLRTLPLSISGIFVGTGLANWYGYHNTLLFILALLTTVGFQITSNFANDYGDGSKGTDNDQRIGPRRAFQSGMLTASELKQGIIISVVINLILVLAVVFFAFKTFNNSWYIPLFILLGIFSILAAIYYTMGKRAYGYRGMGDISVFLFFGLLSVLGSMFLYTKFLTLQSVLPAITIGLLSTGVLNINNLRDHESDLKSSKNTLVVKLGFAWGIRYQVFLILFAFGSLLTFVLLNFKAWHHIICLFGFIPILLHLNKLRNLESAMLLDPELKKLALSTFLVALLFYIGFNNFL